MLSRGRDLHHDLAEDVSNSWVGCTVGDERVVCEGEIRSPGGVIRLRFDDQQSLRSLELNQSLMDLSVTRQILSYGEKF